MTRTSDTAAPTAPAPPPDGGGVSEDDSTVGDPPRPTARRARLRHECLLALEVLALAAFAVARPVLDAFGRSTASLVARDITGGWLVAFAVLVVVVPGLVVAGAGAGARVVAGRARGWVHPVLVGLVGGAGVWRLGMDVTGWPGAALKVQLAVVAAVIVLALLRWNVPITGTFLRFAGLSCAIYVVNFLVLSPASAMLWFGHGSLDAELVADVGTQLGDDPPDVLFVVFDALPVVSLLDGTGHIDGELYPNFAALAGDGTWYRNNTTVAAFTQDAVPALLTGRYPDGSERTPFSPSDTETETLFTLLGGNYDVQAHQQITALCEDAVCPPELSPDLGGLLGDAADFWLDHGGAAEAEEPFLLPLPPGYDDARDWLEQVDLAPGDQPHLVFHHVMLPHEPLEVTDDGTRYDASPWLTGHELEGWSTSGVAVGLQRHLLQVQAADRVLGQYLEALRAAGTYDDTLIVVTADHGKAFIPEVSSRGLTAENYPQIMWTPLVIKAPGQSGGRIDDSDIRSIDVVPTVAGMLGVDIPWYVDGQGAGTDERDGATKPLADHGLNVDHPPPSERFNEVDARAGFAEVLATDQVEGTGPDGVWERTAHGGLVRRPVDELTVGDPGDGAIGVAGLAELDDIDTGEPLPLEVVGTTDLAEGTTVAYALNGTIGAVTEVEPGLSELSEGSTLAHGLVPPSLFVDGSNELTAYVVEGEVGTEVLHPVAVGAG